MIIALALLFVAFGSLAFHIWSPWWWTPIASNWGFIDTTILITFWVTGIVFVLVMVFTAFCVFRYRYRPDRRAKYQPEDNKLEWWLTILTTIGVVVMLAPGLIAWDEFVTVPEGAAEVEALGEQWQWTYRYPGKDGVMGKTSIRLMNDKNPFGIDPKDSKGQDDVLITDSVLHLPLNKPVKMLLRSKDVLHDFYVPQFRAKMDLVPGQITYFWLTPTRTGTFDILCYELCGIGHYAMRGKVVVETESAFKAWLGKQPTFAKSMAKAGPGPENQSDPVLQEARADPPKEGSVQ